MIASYYIPFIIISPLKTPKKDRGPEHLPILPHPRCAPWRPAKARSLHCGRGDFGLASDAVHDAILGHQIPPDSTRFHVKITGNQRRNQRRNQNDWSNEMPLPGIMKKIICHYIISYSLACHQKKYMCYSILHLQQKEREPAPAPKPFLC